MVGGSAPCLGAFGQKVFGVQYNSSMRYDSSRSSSSIYHRTLCLSLDAIIARSGGNEDEQSENKVHRMPRHGLFESSSLSDIVIAITEATRNQAADTGHRTEMMRPFDLLPSLIPIWQLMKAFWMNMILLFKIDWFQIWGAFQKWFRRNQ